MNGVLIIDKPKGWTSQEVVTKVKRTVEAKKAGHGGTLDPLATGVLPIYLNEATKLVPFNLEGTKDYRAVLKLGQETDTLDAEGRITAESPNFNFQLQDLLAVLERFRGKIWQVPPVYSAIKKDGKPLYRWARAGEKPIPGPRQTVIHGLTLRDFSPPLVTLEITCGRGTYIRSLCADIGKALGCGAHLVELRRLRSGKFRIDQSLELEEFAQQVRMNTLDRYLIPLKDGTDKAAEIRVDPPLAQRIRQGRPFCPEDLPESDWSRITAGDRILLLNGEENLLAIAEAQFKERRGDFHPPVAIRILRVFRHGS